MDEVRGSGEWKVSGVSEVSEVTVVSIIIRLYSRASDIQ